MCLSRVTPSAGSRPPQDPDPQPANQQQFDSWFHPLIPDLGLAARRRGGHTASRPAPCLRCNMWLAGGRNPQGRAHITHILTARRRSWGARSRLHSTPRAPHPASANLNRLFVEAHVGSCSWAGAGARSDGRRRVGAPAGALYTPQQFQCLQSGRRERACSL